MAARLATDRPSVGKAGKFARPGVTSFFPPILLFDLIFLSVERLDNLRFGWREACFCKARDAQISQVDLDVRFLLFSTQLPRSDSQ